MDNHNDNTQKKILIYQTDDGSFQTDVQLQGETVWLTQKQMSDLINTSTDNIGLHLKNIYAEGELPEEATTEDCSVVRTEGARKVKRLIKDYNLDAIISAGYRVNSRKGTQFRVWANQILRQYLLQGYALNEVRLKQQLESIEKLKKGGLSKGLTEEINIEEATNAVNRLKEKLMIQNEATDLFGKPNK